MTVSERRAYQKAWRLKNADKVRAQARARTQKFRNNNRAHVNEQARMYARAKLPTPTRPCPDLCEACHKPHHHALCLDHNHVTGEFRGWLCKPCNLALGYAKDNIDVLQGLTHYLLDA